MLSAFQICFLLVIAAVGALAQLCLKQGSMRSSGRRFAAILTQPSMWLGITLMVVNVLAFTWILRKVPLTTAMPFAAIVYILVPVGARYFYAERLLPRFWLGVVLIGIGVILTVI